MPDHAANQVEQLRAALAAKGEDFALLSGLPDTWAHVQFIGRFEGREVAWDMRLYTLARYQQERDDLPAASAASLRGLMHIELVSESLCQLEVALKVAAIDASTILKTIVMMRNYRRLRVGLRTWRDENQLGSESN